MKRELGIARCGLACCLCGENEYCAGCTDCAEKAWCVNRVCCDEKDVSSCASCSETACRKGILAKIKPRAFNEFIRRYGVDELLDCLERNEQNGVVYHRDGIWGDYDYFDDIEELIRFIQTGKEN